MIVNTSNILHELPAALLGTATGALLLWFAQKIRRVHRCGAPPRNVGISGEALSEGSQTQMEGVNEYGRQLTARQIRKNEHREFVGGLWEEIGAHQLNFLQRHGLMNDHLLLDVGCGCLRGGIPCIRYLEAGNYFGLDINASLIKAGLIEIEREGLTERRPNLLVNDKFEFSRFDRTFDYAIALSLFTHLPMNHIIRCLIEIRKVLSPGAQFFATFFEAPSSAHLERVRHTPGDIQTNYDSDPYHYSFEECRMMARAAGAQVRLIGAWDHPRDQRMLSFTAD
jgi:2-polyprenyl-3-methyl-5-hydroxy-6-metoxy-1,4-benzoquinol methylase